MVRVKKSLLVLTLLMASIVLGTVPMRAFAADTFSVSAGPASATQQQGGSSVFDITVTALFDSPVVTLSIAADPSSSLPASQKFTVQLGPQVNTATYHSVFIVTSKGSTPSNPYLFVIDGKSGAEEHQVAVMIQVNAASVIITPSPLSRSITKGDSAQFGVDIAPVGAFNQTLYLTATTPTGFDTSAIAPDQNIPPYSSTLRVFSRSTTTSGTYIVTIAGHIGSASGDTIYSAGVTVIVGAANFTLSVVPLSLSITRNMQGRFNATVTPLAAFSLPVTVSVTAPAGFTATVSPPSNFPPFTSAIMVTPGDSVSPGVYVLTVSGAAGDSGSGGVFQTSVQVIVTTWDFSVAVSPPSATLAQGGSALFNIGVTKLNNFLGAVTLTANGPPGLTPSLFPASGNPSFNSTMRIDASSGITEGSYIVVITGTGGGATRIASVTITVTTSGFTISIAPPSASVSQGGSASFVVTVAKVGTFSGTVTLSTSTSSQLNATIGPKISAPPFTSTLVVPTSSTTPLGTYVVIVHGESGSKIVEASVSITVTSSTFSVSMSPGSATTTQGGSTSFAVSVTPTGSFQGSVTLASTSPDSTIIVTVGPAVGNAPFTATLMVSTSKTTPLGSYLISVTGTNAASGVSQAASAVVTVSESSFTVSVTPASADLTQGSSATFTVSVASTGTYTGTVTLTTTATGLTASIAPSVGTPPYSGILLVTASSTATVGTYLVKVTGTDGIKTEEVGVSVAVGISTFAISMSPETVSLYQTESTTLDVSITITGTFTGSVTLTVDSTLPANIVPITGNPPFTASVIITTTKSDTPGIYLVKVTATSGTETQETASIVTLLEKPPDYTITVITKGLESPASSLVYLDSVEQDTAVSDGANVVLGPFDGLTTHRVSVEYNVTEDVTEYIIKGSTSMSVSNIDSKLENVNAKFSYTKYWQVSFTSSGLPDGARLSITAGGTGYGSQEVPFTVETWQKDASSMSFQSSPKTVRYSGRDYTFLRWKDASGKEVKSPLTVAGTMTLTVVYAPTNVVLTVYDVAGANVTFNSIVQTVPSSGYVSFKTTNGTYTLTATDVIAVSAGSGNRFKYWTIPKGTNSTNPSLSISMTLTSDKTVEVVRALQYRLTVTSPYGSAQGSGWYSTGTSAQFSVDETVSTGTGARQSCTGYTGDATGNGASGSIVMSSPKTVTFTWKLQYSLTVNSQYGTASGAGWYNVDTQASFGITPPEEEGTRYNFVGWSGDFTGTDKAGTVKMSAAQTVTATWTRDFETAISFTDAKGTALTTAPTKLVATDPSGTEKQFTEFADVWLPEGTWTAQTGIVSGQQVGIAGAATYSPTPKGSWTISLQVYDVTVIVTGTVVTSGVANVRVALTLPDGTVAEQVTDGTGSVLLSQIPAGSYSLTAQGFSSSATTRIDVPTAEPEVTVRIISPTEMAIAAVVLIALVAALALAVRSRLKGRPPKAPKEQPAPPTEERPVQPAEPKVGGDGEETIEVTDEELEKLQVRR